MKKTKSGDPRDGWYVVTPNDAEALLAGQPGNRPIRKGKVEWFSESMASGEWRPNGEPLILDDNGQLLDGQGRCSACVLANRPFTTYVVWGIPREHFPSIDIGQNRTGADTLAALKLPNYTISSSVAGLAIRYDAGSPTHQTRIPNQDIAQWATEHQEELRSAFVEASAWITRWPLPPSIGMFGYIMARRYDADKARQFFGLLATGEQLPSGSPILMLRERMNGLRGQTHLMTPHEKVAVLIKAWNAHVEGRPIGVLRWTAKGVRAGKNAEPFPSFICSAQRHNA